MPPFARHAALAAALVLPAPLWAGDIAPVQSDPVPVVAAPVAASPDLVFTLRGGVSSKPEYFGSDEYGIGPDVAFGLKFLRLPGGQSFGDPDPRGERQGFGLRGAFRYIGARDSSDFRELRGLDDVDRSLEIGLGIGYTARNFEAFADLRYGVIGHESLVGEIGADLKMRPSDRLTLTLGPRVEFGADDYVDTYFGVTPAESVRSGLGAYNPGGGIVSAGVELGATYRLSDDWGLEGAVTWDRFVGDAADSPIVRQGERDQYGVRFGLTRRISLDF